MRKIRMCLKYGKEWDRLAKEAKQIHFIMKTGCITWSEWFEKKTMEEITKDLNGDAPRSGSCADR